jgi:hypothetical protein
MTHVGNKTGLEAVTGGAIQSYGDLLARNRRWF